MAFVAIALLGIVLSQRAWAVCGYEGVSVSGTNEEIADACQALDEALSYFKRLNFQPKPEQLSIVFRDHVEIDVYLQDYGPAGGQPAGKSEVSGFFNFRRNELQITSGRRELHRERRPWGIAWGNAIAYSILQHELAHAVVASLLGSKYQKFGKAWHEFIAYAIQFDLMDGGLKSKVLANYPDAEPFRYPESVNAIVHAADPDAFGVAAYLFTEANGGLAFIGKILTREVPFSTEEFEFLWVE
jgi:hypothetical protein